ARSSASKDFSPRSPHSSARCSRISSTTPAGTAPSSSGSGASRTATQFWDARPRPRSLPSSPGLARRSRPLHGPLPSRLTTEPVRATAASRPPGGAPCRHASLPPPSSLSSSGRAASRPLREPLLAAGGELQLPHRAPRAGREPRGRKAARQGADHRQVRGAAAALALAAVLPFATALAEGSADLLQLHVRRGEERATA